MDDSVSRPRQRHNRLRRLSQAVDKHSDQEEQIESKQPQQQQQRVKRQKVITSKDEKKQHRRRSSRRTQIKDSVDQHIKQQSISPQNDQKVDKDECNKIIQKAQNQKRDNLYKSSQGSDNEENIGFVGMEATNKLKKGTRTRKPKNEIRASNRFFKGDLFEHSFDPLCQADTAEAECLELRIETKAAPSKTVDFFTKKVEASKRQKTVSVQHSQQENSNHLIQENEFKRMVGSSLDETGQLDIELQVPRKTGGKKNEILDNTLFIKQLKDKPAECDTVAIQQKIKARKKVSREEYIRQIDEDIKNRKAQHLSSQQICQSFVMTSLNDLKSSKVVVVQTKQIQVRQFNSVSNISIIAKKKTIIIENDAKNDSKISVTQPKHTQVDETDLNKTKDGDGIQPLINVKPIGSQPELEQLNNKPTKNPNPKPKPKPRNAILDLFQNEAQESGKEVMSGSDGGGEDEDLPGLINDEVVYNNEHEHKAYQKYLEDEIKRDEQIIKRITTKQYPKKRKFQNELDQSESKNARMRDVRNMIKRRSDQSHQDDGSNILPRLMVAADESQEEEVDITSQLRAQMALKNKPQGKWSFVEPKKSIGGGLVLGKRHSLLSVAEGATAITNFKYNQAKREPKPMASSCVNRMLRTPSQDM